MSASAHRSTQYLALGAVLLCLLLSFATSQEIFGPNPVGTTSSAVKPLLIPPGPAFGIWALIYTGLLVFPIYQIIKNRNNSELWLPLRRLFAANLVANGLWLVFASYDWQLLTIGVIAFMLWSQLRILLLLERIEAAGVPHSYWLERFVFSVYTGWVTLATVLNVTSALYFYGWDGGGMSPVTWTLVMTGAAAVIAGYVAWRFRDGVYGLVVVWAFGWLAHRHLMGPEAGPQVLAYGALAVVGAFAVFSGWLLLRSKDRLEVV